MNTAEFYKFPKDLARAIGYVCQSTGEMVRFTPSTKIVYAYMISRNEFFTGRMKGCHFESHKVIADSCGMEEKACGKILRKMMEHGLIEAEKKQPEKGGHSRYYYEIVKTDIHLWVGCASNPEMLKKGHTARAELVDERDSLPPLEVYDNIQFEEWETQNEDNPV